eukprot:884409-Alexandrium_andersonii.AAC.1
MQMQVEHNVPIIPAEFLDADLLDAESEVVKFVLAFFGSIEGALPLLRALSAGLNCDALGGANHDSGRGRSGIHGREG